MSYRVEVIAGSNGKWASNGLRFASIHEAQNYAFDLASRWTWARDTRVVDDDRPATHSWTDNGVISNGRIK
jgi:hypothetical protein